MNDLFRILPFQGDEYSETIPAALRRAGIFRPYRAFYFIFLQDSKRLFVDLNNTQIDIATDRVTPSGRLRFEIFVPENWRDKKIKITVLSPHGKPNANIKMLDNGRLAIEVDNILFYACLVLEPQD
ncbi:MAG: hypothetical protein LBQ50_05335 [Planctomycetaceae bacterium]|jgi:hypothetical protein|nr:hypothetical protein [Planctomycetaceae bacterium]